MNEDKGTYKHFFSFITGQPMMIYWDRDGWTEEGTFTAQDELFLNGIGITLKGAP